MANKEWIIEGTVREESTNHKMRISRIALCDSEAKALYAFKHHARNYGLLVTDMKADKASSEEVQAGMLIFENNEHLDNYKRN